MKNIFLTQIHADITQFATICVRLAKICVHFALMFIFGISLLYAEEVTITTYYPAPEGVYDELRASKMAIGPNYYDASSYSIPTNTSLIIEPRVGIGTSNPNSAALLDLTSTTQGLLLPRMTKAQRDAIVSPPAGLTIYNTTTNLLEYCNNKKWTTNSGFWAANGNDIYNTNSGKVGIGTSIPSATLQIKGSFSRDSTTLTGTDAEKATQVNLGVNSTTGGSYSTIGGGYSNKATADYSTVLGGQSNEATGYYATVGGGYQNKASGQYSAITGGYQNRASGSYSGVIGGRENKATGDYAIVGGGYQNEATGAYSTVFGGYGVKASGDYSVVLGGMRIDGSPTINQEAAGAYSVVMGGSGNQAIGDYSVAAGKLAKAADSYSFVWSDGSLSPSQYSSNGPHTFNILASGGAFLWRGGSWQFAADLAESMDVVAKDKVQETELVSLLGKDLLGRSAKPYDDNLIGVISSKRTMLLHLGSTNKAKKGAVKLPVALVGRCFVKVTNEEGPIKIGDPITSSSTPGIGMKAAKSGKIIGYAMQEELFKDKNTSEIVVFINSGYYLPKSEYEELKKKNQDLLAQVEWLEKETLALGKSSNKN